MAEAVLNDIAPEVALPLPRMSYPAMMECPWNKQLGLTLVRWYGVYEDAEMTWLRWATLDGELLPTPQEALELERQRAETERQRAEAEA